ncbi:SH3 domain-containing protein, partial [Clostridium perfringens]
GNVVRQGYVTNATNLIRYFNQSMWHNGSTPEEVLDENGGHLGSLNPYESATPLYKKNGMTHVVYDTDKGFNTKSGYVKYEGAAATRVDIPYPSITNAQKIVYGTSGRGRELAAYKIGNGLNSLVFVCAIHGWEDKWPADGIELTRIGNGLIEHFQNASTNNWSLYIIPVANPDGLSEGFTNNGPGRCTIVGAVDCNRDFPLGFSKGGVPRYHSGNEPLSVPESRGLHDFIQGIKNRTSGEMCVIDLHGWEGAAIGNPEVGQYFRNQFGFEQRYGYGDDRGFMIGWAKSIGAKAALIELPGSTNSHSDVVNGRYLEKIINAVTNLLNINISSTSSTSKWEKKDNKWYYYENGNMVTGWKLVDGKWYYLESNGVMAIGWKELGGIWYYLNESGAMVKGWQTISGKTYYFNDSGHMLVGKQVIDGRNYNFNTSGQLDSTNWVKSNNKWYYYENGKMITGWKLINGEWYYLEGSGVMATGWKELGGIWYYLNESGAMVKGWQTISGKTYYFNDSGHMLLGKQTIDGKSYEFNGSGQLISDTGDISLSESTYIVEGEVIDVQTILNVRKGPGTNYDSIGQLHQGDKVSIVAKNGEWYKISSPIAGYVHKNFIKIKEASNSSEDKKSPSMQGFVEVLTKLYNIVESNYKSYSIKEKNEIVLDYLRKEKYSIRNGRIDGKVWSALFAPSKYEWLESKVDSKLKDDAENYTKNIPIGKYKIESPHLAATTLGYSKNNIQLSVLPRFWTGWGGDFATLVGEAAKESLFDENKIYEKAMELLGGNSTFSDSDFYADIDAIYFAKNLNTAPIYELVKNYYNGLEYKRKELIIDDIGGDINIPLSKRIEDKFNGPHGLGFDKFRYGGSDLLGLDDLRGLGLRFFIYIGAGKGLSGGISAFQTEKYVKAVSKAFANKIETLQNGFLK